MSLDDLSEVRRSRFGAAFLTAMTLGLAACGGGDVSEDLRREPLAATVSTTAAPAYDPDDLYRFFAIAFGAAPGVTYMGQLLDAANAGMSIKAIVNVFTTKSQFLETYPASLTNQEYAQKLVDNVVGTSATAAAKAEAVADIVAALSLPNWTRGDITYAIFNNLAKKPADDAKWAGTARKMASQVVYARHYTETMKVNTTDLTQLRAVVNAVTESSSVNTVDLSNLIQTAVNAALAQPPFARASVDRPVVFVGATVSLDGRNSFDLKGGALSYRWTLSSKPAGSAAVLTSTSTAQTSLVADIPGDYNATLVVSAAGVDSTANKISMTALPVGGANTGLAVLASYDPSACTLVQGCKSNVLTDFVLTSNLCTIKKQGAVVTLSQPGVAPISATFDSVQDRVDLTSTSLGIALTNGVVGLEGRINILINRTNGSVTLAEAVANGRSLTCTYQPSGLFPGSGPVTAITQPSHLISVIDTQACSTVTPIFFGGCGAKVLPDFEMTVGTCKLSKAREVLTVTQAGKPPISAKLNGDSQSYDDSIREASSIVFENFLPKTKYTVYIVAADYSGDGGSRIVLAIDLDRMAPASLFASEWVTSVPSRDIKCL